MKRIRIRIDHKQSLLDGIRSAGYFLPADCGGQGRCGKCKVRILAVASDGEREISLGGEAGIPAGRMVLAVTAKDADCLSKEDLSGGWRLACLVRGAGSFLLDIPDYNEDEVFAVGYSGEPDTPVSRDSAKEDEAGRKPVEKEAKTDSLQGIDSKENLALAVDIGTTTLAACLIRPDTGEILGTATGINHQRVYGADVLSRIDAANRGEGEKLKDLVIGDLNSLCQKLGLTEDVCNRTPYFNKSIFDLTMPVIISGNSTMEHLLQGLSCKTLGLYPFDPVDISLHAWHNMTILPGLSTYVGADIVSGIVACGIDRRQELSILVDLGTNGEMVIGNKDRILAASTAAGPAFEGGNISCGMAGIPGAIDRVVIDKGQVRVSTIAGKKAVGLCGTGVIETVYELKKEGYMDETGLLADPWFDQGFPLADHVIFSAKDIREVQLAKAAIRAGIEVLLKAYGVSADQIDRLYLAGGFGLKLDGEKAVGIGMLPEELKDRILAVGNTSLKGAVLFATDPKISRRFDHVIKISKEITLSEHDQFNDLYLEHMFFPEEDG